MTGNPVWYLFVNESQYGPVTLEVLRQWIAEGRVQAGDLVWDFAGERWQPARAFPELQGATGGADGTAWQSSMPAAEELAGTRVYFTSYRDGRSERRFIRLATCLQLTYQEFNPFNNELISRPATSTIENISPGGMAFEVHNKAMREKTRLRLEIRLPRRAAPVVIMSEVTRVVAFPQFRYLIGVGFRETNQADQDALFAYLRELLAGMDSPASCPENQT